MFSDEAKKGLLSFIGYGRPSAPIWFIGAEEGLGGHMNHDDEENNLHARAKWQEFMDLDEAHQTLTEGGNNIDITEKIKRRKGSITVWLWMSRIALAYEGLMKWDDKKNKEKARKFVQTRLGRRNDTTFLTELSPVPEKRTGEPKWLAELRTGNLSEKLYMERETRIKDLLKLEKPKCVICYGLGKKKEFAKLLGVDWVELPETDRVFKAPKNSFFLLPFFGQGISHELVKGLVTHPSFLAQ